MFETKLTTADKRARGQLQIPPAISLEDGSPYLPAGRTFRRILIFVLAVALAIVGLVLALRPESAVFALTIMSILSAVGLAALFAIAAGYLGIARDGLGEVRALVADTLESGVAVVDSLGRVVYANAAYAEFVGDASRSPERALGQVTEASEALYRVSKAAAAGQAHCEDIRLASPNNTDNRWLRFSTAPAQSSSDGPKGHYQLWRVADISGEATRQENAFHELQQIINYLDHAPAGFFSLGPDGRIAYLNATLAGWLGLSLDSTAGGGLNLDEITASDAASMLVGVKPVRGGSRIENLDIDLRKSDGARLPVRVIHRATFDDQGKLMFSRSLVVERAAVPADADGMRAIETRFLGFFGAAPIGIAMLDAGGSVDRCNAAFTRLFGVGNLRGKALVDLVDKDSQDELVTALQQGRLGRVVSEPVDVTFGNGRFGQMYFSILDDVPGRSGGLLVYAIDRTEQHLLETQISQGQKMAAVGQLAGGVAHDFNNVLTAIIGFSDLLLANHRPTDPSFQDIMNIRQNANRAAGLVRQLLAFSRQQTLRPVVIQISDVIADVSVLLNRLLGEKTELGVDHGRDVWPVRTDVNQFEQVIVNLVVNARDAMQESGKVTISTANVSADDLPTQSHGVMPPADYVEIAVSDTGTGIPKENLEKIFDPFFSTKDVGKGTGLGLSTVYGIVKQTEGFIFVESEVGEGTTFRIFLPRHIKAPEGETGPADAAGADIAQLTEDVLAADDLGPRKPEKKAPPTDLTGTGTILLVEDEDAVRAFAKRALESKGYTVLGAPSGEEALEIAEENEGTIDLVISDVIMPEMDGPTLVKELQKRYSELKIIFISGYAEAEFRKSVEDSEDFSFLPKPFSLKKLAETVKTKMES